MMASNNNEARKKQEITEAVDNGGNSSLPITPAVVVVPPALSFGTILEEFPDFLSCVLVYIDDRVIWNSIASSNKDMHEKSKAIRPPWPLYYKLPSDDSYSDMAWSPCGTRIACSVNYVNIVVFDQRVGPLRNNGHINAHGGYQIHDLKYSPNGRFLVSTGYDEFVRLWDTVTGNYEQLQEWNMREEAATELIGAIPKLCISACSKYIAVSLGKCVFLKNVDGKTIKSFVDEKVITKTVFASNGCVIFICFREYNGNTVLKVWYPYLDDDDEDRLITLWRREGMNRGFQTVTFSNDNTMVAIHDEYQNKGTVWSIAMDHKCRIQKLNIPTSSSFHFTPDGKYIIYNKENGSTLWSIPEGRISSNTLRILDNENNTKRNVGCFSPNNRQLIIQELGNLYVTSYFVK